MKQSPDYEGKAEIKEMYIPRSEVEAVLEDQRALRDAAHETNRTKKATNHQRIALVLQQILDGTYWEAV